MNKLTPSVNGMGSSATSGLVEELRQVSNRKVGGILFSMVRQLRPMELKVEEFGTHVLPVKSLQLRQ